MKDSTLRNSFFGWMIFVTVPAGLVWLACGWLIWKLYF